MAKRKPVPNRTREALAEPAVGDRIRVTVKPHMPGQKSGTVREVKGNALGIEFDSAPGETHHWYLDTEVRVTGG